MKSIRGGMGLGDALYVQAVARHLVRKGEQLKVCTAWPDVFRYLPVKTAPFTRMGIDILAHYSSRKKYETKQFEDVCITAGIKEPVEFRLDWKVTDPALVDRLQQHGRPIVLVQLPRAPMGRTDGFGRELLPDCRQIQKLIDALRGRVLLVQIGSGEPLFRFKGLDVDLSNETTVSQMIDVATACSGMVGYVSFLVPLAESLDKPAVLVWSHKGLKAKHPYIRQITPQKVLYKPTSRWALDCEENIEKVLDGFC